MFFLIGLPDSGTVPLLPRPNSPHPPLSLKTNVDGRLKTEASGILEICANMSRY